MKVAFSVKRRNRTRCFFVTPSGLPSNLLLHRLSRITDKCKLTEADISMIAAKLCAIHNKNYNNKGSRQPVACLYLFC